MTKLLAAAALSAVAFCSSQPAFAQTKGVIGTLTCTGGEGVGYIIGSQKSYACRYVPTAGRAERYTATVSRIGVDVGITGKSTMVWTVLGSASAAKQRALAGSYGGASADASLGIGGGAKVLVGGSNDSIVLQPLSVQAQTGANIAVGITSLTLR